MSALIAANILSGQSVATVHFIGMVDNLFDFCNGSSKDPPRGNQYHCAVSDTFVVCSNANRSQVKKEKL